MACLLLLPLEFLQFLCVLLLETPTASTYLIDAPAVFAEPVNHFVEAHLVLDLRHISLSFDLNCTEFIGASQSYCLHELGLLSEFCFWFL